MLSEEGLHGSSRAIRQNKFIAQILSVRSRFLEIASNQRHLLVLEMLRNNFKIGELENSRRFHRADEYINNLLISEI